MDEQHKADLIDGLRSLADWLETNPRVADLPNFRPYVSEWIYEYAKDENGITNYSEPDDELSRAKMRQILKALGSCKKDYSGSTFSLKKEFGPIRLAFQTSRETICRKVVTGSREVPEVVLPARTEEVVEWVCEDPLLAS